MKRKKNEKKEMRTGEKKTTFCVNSLIFRDLCLNKYFKFVYNGSDKQNLNT